MSGETAEKLPRNCGKADESTALAKGHSHAPLVSVRGAATYVHLLGAVKLGIIQKHLPLQLSGAPFSLT